jgi:hypothetical protein
VPSPTRSAITLDARPSSTIGDHGQRHVGLGGGPSASPVDAFDAFRRRKGSQYTETVMTNKSKMFGP